MARASLGRLVPANWRPEQVQQSVRTKLRYSITSLARVNSVGGTGIDRAPSSG